MVPNINSHHQRNPFRVWIYRYFKRDFCCLKLFYFSLFPNSWAPTFRVKNYLCFKSEKKMSSKQMMNRYPDSPKFANHCGQKVPKDNLCYVNFKFLLLSGWLFSNYFVFIQVLKRTFCLYLCYRNFRYLV